MLQLKDYLTLEQERNKKHAELYTWIVKRAFGQDCDVIVGHHIGFERHGDISTETEIPSADTLLFNQEIMYAAFDIFSYQIIESLTTMEPGEREEHVVQWMNAIIKQEGDSSRSTHVTEVA